ncbi:MAG: DUF262 domain-containing protein [Ignavibacteria bacterium]|nr:DUF262 domain-containing protein [Ignavibacteria bacterium]
MKIRDTDDGSILQFLTKQEKILVPEYQRRYSWKEKHWRDIWKDINDLKKDEDHFLGTLTFVGETASQGRTNKFEIVDGQQRVTTIFIMLCALRDFYEEKKKTDVKNHKELDNKIKKIDQYLWLFDSVNNEKVDLKLELGNLDHDSYSKLVESNIEYVDNVLIKDAYVFFYKKLESSDDLQIDEFHRKLLYNVRYASITFEEDSGAYRLFEILNNRGLALTPTDLIKNHLFRVCFEKGLIGTKVVKRLWSDIIKNLDGILDVRFFRQYLMSSKKFPVNEKVTSNKLYNEHFKKIIDKNSNIEELLHDIEKASSLYNKMYYKKIDNFNITMNERVNEKLKELSTIGDVGFTLLLRVFNELKNEIKDSEQIIKIIEIINILLLRRSICGWSTSEHDTIFNHLAQNAFKKDNPLEYIIKYLKNSKYMPDDNTFINEIKKAKFKTNNRTRYILSQIEESHYGRGGRKVQDRYLVHIEHIMPQRLGELGKKWLKYANMTKAEHEKYKNKIGNLTLLEKKPNIAASNLLYDEKMKLYTSKKTEMVMTNKILDIKKWDKVSIEKRGEDLARIIAKIWKLK